MSSIKAIIFDFGGTLDTDGIHWSEKFWDIYCIAGVGCTKPEYERAYVASEKKILTSNYDKLPFKDIFRVSLINQLEYLYPGERSKTQTLSSRLLELLYDDVVNKIEEAKDVLRSLKKDFKLGLVSNFYGNLKEICEELDLSMFDTMIDSEIVRIRKPDPEIFSLAVKELKLNASDCIVVGDSYDNDIEPAKGIGCKTIWLKGKSWREFDNTIHADYTIKSIKEIPAIVYNLK
ncbi:MAG: HAD family hydrolase [Ignavibacteriae bacterium]|nr:MAG: HAD family hydrolase [Ignavibacteriota bacterium]